MSTSRHPIALRLERSVGEGTKLLATVMALPLVDGIFPALILAGAVGSVLGILEVGLLVFGGSATLAVVLADMEGTRREQVVTILLVGIPLMALAALEAAIAPTIAEMLNMPVFERFAALVILAIAAKTASATVGEYLPSPGVIVGLGLIASFDPSGLAFGDPFVADPMLVARGVAAAGVGVGFALSVALLGPWLRGNVDIDRFRFGSAVALGVLPLSILGIIQTNVPIALAVLAITSLLALDPSDNDDPAPVETATGAVPDGGEADAAEDPEPVDVDEAYEDNDDDDSRGTPGVTDGDRAPWL
ncbi:DUF5794 domain-containing protein [Halorarius litoreus]|uniref:DUF5794 domain-containing protein n=1 Tax=Halorarius litoreus TaxID=2962676 RepID=UPI0020CC9CBC|nr:DUF5794 domain-containing protein [Halorarius litoreus]